MYKSLGSAPCSKLIMNPIVSPAAGLVLGIVPLFSPHAVDFASVIFSSLCFPKVNYLKATFIMQHVNTSVTEYFRTCSQHLETDLVPDLEIALSPPTRIVLTFTI